MILCREAFHVMIRLVSFTVLSNNRYTNHRYELQKKRIVQENTYFVHCGLVIVGKYRTTTKIDLGQTQFTLVLLKSFYQTIVKINYESTKCLLGFFGVGSNNIIYFFWKK